MVSTRMERRLEAIERRMDEFPNVLNWWVAEFHDLMDKRFAQLEEMIRGEWRSESLPRLC